MNRPIHLALSFCVVAFAAFNARAGADSKFIQILSPRGGEVYIVGQSQKIQVKSSLKTLTVELSKNGGTTFSPLGTLDYKATAGVFTWTVPAGATTNAVIRVSGVKSGLTVSSTSSAFVIDTGVSLGGGQVTTNGMLTVL